MHALFLDDNEAEDTNRSIILHCVKKGIFAEIWHFVFLFPSKMKYCVRTEKRIN